MNFLPDSYKDIALETYEQTDESPSIPPSPWEGVIISGPQRIVHGKDEHPIVPVCGYYLVPVLNAMDGAPLTVHVTHLGSKITLFGEVAEEPDNEPLILPPPGAPEPSRESFVGVQTGSYFNIDAQRYLQARLLPGTYQVTISFAGAESNSIQVEIEIQ